MRILSNPVYVGRLRHKGQIHDGLHPAIVDPETWDRAPRATHSIASAARPWTHGSRPSCFREDRSQVRRSHSGHGGRTVHARRVDDGEVVVRLSQRREGLVEAAAPASPSRGPGNGILRAETGGRIQAQNAGEQSEFGSQTTLRLTNPPELRGFLSTRKPPRFVGTAWWGMQELN